MAQLYSFAALRVPRVLALNLRSRGARHAEAHNLGHFSCPETPLTVEFVGISEAEQRAALAAFPGGRRFRLISGPRGNG